jgi:hypothetical protein
LENTRWHGIKMDTSQYTLGRRLIVDPKRESIPDDKEANAMLTRDYRKPYIVPTEV